MRPAQRNSLRMPFDHLIGLLGDQGEAVLVDDHLEMLAAHDPGCLAGINLASARPD